VYVGTTPTYQRKEGAALAKRLFGCDTLFTGDLDVCFASPPPILILAGQGLTTLKAGEGLTKRTSSLRSKPASSHWGATTKHVQPSFFAAKCACETSPPGNRLGRPPALRTTVARSRPGRGSVHPGFFPRRVSPDRQAIGEPLPGCEDRGIVRVRKERPGSPTFRATETSVSTSSTTNHGTLSV